MKCLKCYSETVKKNNKLICTKCKSVFDIDTLILAKYCLDIVIRRKKEDDMYGKIVNKNSG